MKTNQQGFIKAIILIVVALLVLKYAFGMNLSDILNSQIAQDIWNIIKQIFSLFIEAIKISINYIKSSLPEIQKFLNSVPKSTN